MIFSVKVFLGAFKIKSFYVDELHFQTVFDTFSGRSFLRPSSEPESGPWFSIWAPPPRCSVLDGSVVAVTRQGQFLTLLGLEEGVGQRDGVHPGHPGVLVELRVDVEEDGHVHLLMGVQTLLLEAETLQRDDREAHV